MPLKLVKRPKSPNWIMRGTVRGQSIEETTGTADKETAEAIRIKRENDLLTESVYGKELTVTFAHAALDYLEHGNADQRFLKQIVDYFGKMLLRDIDQHALDVGAKKLYPKAANSTRNRQFYTPVSAILHHAARKKMCPVPLIERPKQPPGKLRWLKPAEAEQLLAACPKHLRPLVVFMLYTGARAGEAVWLDWSTVDLDYNRVTFPKTKNGSARSVPLHGRVVQELAALPLRTGPVFLTHRRRPYESPRAEDKSDQSAGSRINTAFRSAVKAAGLGWTVPDDKGKLVWATDVTPHVCRHTWATWHYQANRDFTALQKLGGWKTASMVFRYAHTNPDEHANSINALPWGNSGENQLAKVG